MEKKILKAYLSEEDIKNLRKMALESGFFGRAWFTRLNEKFAREDIAFLSHDVKKIISLLNYKSQLKENGK